MKNNRKNRKDTKPQHRAEFQRAYRTARRQGFSTHAARTFARLTRCGARRSWYAPGRSSTALSRDCGPDARQGQATPGRGRRPGCSGGGGTNRVRQQPAQPAGARPSIPVWRARALARPSILEQQRLRTAVITPLGVSTQANRASRQLLRSAGRSSSGPFVKHSR